MVVLLLPKCAAAHRIIGTTTIIVFILVMRAVVLEQVVEEEFVVRCFTCVILLAGAIARSFSGAMRVLAISSHCAICLKLSPSKIRLMQVPSSQHAVLRGANTGVIALVHGWKWLKCAFAFMHALYQAFIFSHFIVCCKQHADSQAS